MFFSFFAVMCARGLAHSPSTQMLLNALKGLYIFDDPFFQCLHVVLTSPFRVLHLTLHERNRSKMPHLLAVST